MGVVMLSELFYYFSLDFDSFDFYFLLATKCSTVNGAKNSYVIKENKNSSRKRKAQEVGSCMLS